MTRFEIKQTSNNRTYLLAMEHTKQNQNQNQNQNIMVHDQGSILAPTEKS